MSSPKNRHQKENPSIELTMKSIEKLLETLENDETPLEESLKDFEEGITLTRRAQKVLSEAEQKVQLLLDENGLPSATGFNIDEENG